eukprot:jgi/Botrbrau1/15434/Bobra.43_2s0059.1
MEARHSHQQERKPTWLQRGVSDALKVIKEGPSQAALDGAQALASVFDEECLKQQNYTMDGLVRALLMLCQFHSEEGRPTAAFLALSRIVQMFPVPKIALQYVEALSDREVKYTALAQLVSLTTEPRQEFCKRLLTEGGASALVCLLSDTSPYVQSVAAHLAHKLITLCPGEAAKFVEAGIVPIFVKLLEQGASREVVQPSHEQHNVNAMKLFNTDLGGCDEWQNGRLAEGLLAEPRLHVCKALDRLVCSRSDTWHVAEQVTAAALMCPRKEYSGETLIGPIECLRSVVLHHPDPMGFAAALLSDGLFDILTDFFEAEDWVLFRVALDVLGIVGDFIGFRDLPLPQARRMHGSLLTYLESNNDELAGLTACLICALAFSVGNVIGTEVKDPLKLVQHLCPLIINGSNTARFAHWAAHRMVLELMGRAQDWDDMVINAAMSNGFIAGTFRLLPDPFCRFDPVQEPYLLALLNGLLFAVAATDKRCAIDAISRGLLGEVTLAVESSDRNFQLFGLHALWELALREETLAQLRMATVWPRLVLSLARSRHFFVLRNLGWCLVKASRDHHSLLLELMVLDVLPQYELSCRSTIVDLIGRYQLFVIIRLLSEWGRAHREEIFEIRTGRRAP